MYCFGSLWPAWVVWALGLRARILRHPCVGRRGFGQLDLGAGAGMLPGRAVAGGKIPAHLVSGNFRTTS